MQNIAIITSLKDPAGINIRNNLIELFNFKETKEKIDNNRIFSYKTVENKNIKLYLINDDLIFAENLDQKIDADIFVFASKHRSKENTPSFAVHPIGNWSIAEFGGKDGKICFSSAFLLKILFIELNNNSKNTKYQATLEATHHGPYLEKPAVFVEIGSTEKEWNDKDNGKIIAETIMNSLENQDNNFKIAVGIGGPHYCNNFNKIMLRSDVAISHICPKYQLENLNGDLIRQAIEKTSEKVDFILLDWKGLGKEKQRVVDLLKHLNLVFKRIENVLQD